MPVSSNAMESGENRTIFGQWYLCYYFITVIDDTGILVCDVMTVHHVPVEVMTKLQIHFNTV